VTRIFEPFFTTKALSTRRGTGLGLSMVYELARKMEAGLAVESVVARGSTFTLIFPKRTKGAGQNSGNGELRSMAKGERSDAALNFSQVPSASADKGAEEP
jgi:hypothetical protein